MSTASSIPALPRQPQTVTRPWGHFLQYANNEPTTVSLMHVRPGQRLSLQSHAGRAELWIVLDDGAEVQVGEAILHPAANDEIWISAGTKHRLSSTGPSVRVLEVAFGNWQQDDIVRYADDYARPGPANESPRNATAAPTAAPARNNAGRLRPVPVVQPSGRAN